MGKKSPLYEEIDAYRQKFDLRVELSTDCPLPRFSARPEAEGLNRIRMQFVRPRDWYCVADLDEFHYFSGGTLPQVAAEAKRRGYSAVHGRFFDRIAKDGSLPEIRGALDQRFPLGCNLSSYLDLRCDKIVLAKSHVVIVAGHHETRANTWRNIAQVHHFKWSKGVGADLMDRHYRYMRQGMHWADRVYPKTCIVINGGINLQMPNFQIWPAAKLGI